MKKNQEQLTAISIEGYKSIGDEVKIKIAPLTVLAGVNSSGKSSFFQPLLLLKQTAEAAFDTQGILLNGSNIKIHDGGSIFTASGKNPKKENVKIGFYFSEGKHFKNYYGETPDSSFDILKSEVNLDSKPICLLPNSKEGTLKKLYTDEHSRYMLKMFLNKEGATLTIDKNHGFFETSINIFSKVSKRTPSKITGGRHLHYVQIAQSFLNFLHIPGIRGNPERNYKLTATKGRYAGRFEDYTASNIYQCKHNKKKQYKKKLK